MQAILRLDLSDESIVKETGSIDIEEKLSPTYTKITIFKTLKIYYLWLVLILVHWFVFVDITSNAQCYSVLSAPPYNTENLYETKTAQHDIYGCNYFTKNGWLVFFYLLFLVYFVLSALQIKYGLSDLRRGSFMMDKFDPVSATVFRGFLAIPFLYELRTILDWTFTKTALDVFQWMKLA